MATLANLTERMVTVENTLNNISVQIANRVDIVTLNAWVLTVKTFIQSLQTQITDLQGQVDALRAEFRSIT